LALGPAARAAAPALLRAITQTAWFVRERDGVCEEGRTLASLDAELTVQVLVPRLADELRSEDYAKVLIELGPKLRSAAPALAALFRAAPDRVQRLVIARVLVASGPAAATAVATLVADLR